MSTQYIVPPVLVLHGVRPSRGTVGVCWASGDCVAYTCFSKRRPRPVYKDALEVTAGCNYDGGDGVGKEIMPEYHDNQRLTLG